jgi:hypothetical protein
VCDNDIATDRQAVEPTSSANPYSRVFFASPAPISGVAVKKALKTGFL